MPSFNIFAVYSQDYFTQMFQRVLDMGGAANTFLETVQVRQNEYYKKQEDFPFTIIPET